MTQKDSIIWPLARQTRAPILILLLAVAAHGCDKVAKTGAAEPGHGTENTAAIQEGHAHNEGEKHSHAEGEAHVDEVKLTGVAVQKYGIKVEKATKRALSPTIVAPARVSFNMEQMSRVGVPVTGRVVELKVRVGDTVKKGDVLLVVDSPDLGEAQSEYLQKRTVLGIAGPALELAQSLYESGQKLLQESQGISKTDVQKQQGELLVAKGALKTAEAAVVAAENKLHLLGMSQEAVDALAKTTEINPKYEVRAPIAGQVVEREVTHGELVRPDKESLLVLADLSTLWVIADLPQSNLQDVAVGSRTRVVAGAGSGAASEGKVSYIAPQIDPSTRSAQVRIELKTDGMGLRAGMFAQAEIETATPGAKSEPMLAVPEEAVQTVEGGPAVFVPVPGEENTFAKRAVKIGEPVAGWIPILGGLKEGEELVVTNSFILKADLGKSSAEHDH